MKTITATELKEQLNQSPNLELIDVRTPAEFGEVHVENARNIPLDTLKPTELSEMRKNPMPPTSRRTRDTKMKLPISFLPTDMLFNHDSENIS